MGVQRGVVDEILTTGVLVMTADTEATMQVPFGEKVGKAGVYGRLTPGGESVDPGLIDKLKSWRLGQARSQGVPAYVVFNDRTLEALAVLRPDTESGLLHVPESGPPSSRPTATSSSTCWVAIRDRCLGLRW